MADSTLPPFIQALLQSGAGAYPHPAPEVTLVQTHISYVLLAGDFVYKIKKPVDFGFLNFTTLEKRKHFCEEELLLNRRLCPSLYLGLVAITEQDGGFSLDGPGTPVEYAVKMARMPEERMMAKVIGQGGLSKEILDRIIGILVPFYAKAESGPAIEKFGTALAVSVNVLENFEQTQGFIGCAALSQEQFEAISGYARDFLKKRSSLPPESRRGGCATATATSIPPTSAWPRRSTSTTASSSTSASATAMWQAMWPFWPWTSISTACPSFPIILSNDSARPQATPPCCPCSTSINATAPMCAARSACSPPMPRRLILPPPKPA